MRVAAGIASMAPAGCRPVFIAGLYLLGIANGAVGSVTSSIISKGFWGALSATFDLSIVALAATVVGLKLTLRTPDRPIDGLDRLVAAVYVISLFIPSGSVSMAGVTFLAFYECLRSFRSVETVASSSLFIGIAACQFWGALLLALLAPSLLALDARMTAGLLNFFQSGGAESVGNLVRPRKDSRSQS